MQGVSEWDGADRGQTHRFGFLLVTHTGSTVYLNAASFEQRDAWMLHVRAALEACFASASTAPFRPSKALLARPLLQVPTLG